MMVGVTNCPSTMIRRRNPAAGRRPKANVGSVTTPTSTRTANIAVGPMIGIKLSVAANAPNPIAFGNPVNAQITPVTAPTDTLISATIKR